MIENYIFWIVTGLLTVITVSLGALIGIIYNNIQSKFADIKQDIGLLFQKIEMLSMNYVNHTEFKELETRLRDCENRINKCKNCQN